MGTQQGPNGTLPPPVEDQAAYTLPDRPEIYAEPPEYVFPYSMLDYLRQILEALTQLAKQDETPRPTMLIITKSNPITAAYTRMRVTHVWMSTQAVTALTLKIGSESTVTFYPTIVTGEGISPPLPFPRYIDRGTDVAITSVVGDGDWQFVIVGYED